VQPGAGLGLQHLATDQHRAAREAGERYRAQDRVRL
jgi:hypothetical protein